jgi:glycosyltransferase involved in cell wall biosynthesis
VRVEEAFPVTRVWLDVPRHVRHLSFDEGHGGRYPAMLADHLGRHGARTVWLYTPMALELADALAPQVLVYDVMDDLASFRGAPDVMRQRQWQALHRADVVFTGGRSLHAGVLRTRPQRTYLFPSGVEVEHYAAAARRRRARGPRTRPVAGYVGVVDERLDLALVAALADALPDWEVRMVGPRAKIDERDLPRRDNLSWLGRRSYGELPEVMTDFDVALMPFALNEATRSISPTKTLEYLAAGLPVVSTRVPDVVADVGHVVTLADDAASFAAACREGLRSRGWAAPAVRMLLHERQWNTIAARMDRIVARVRAPHLGEASA